MYKQVFVRDWREGWKTFVSRSYLWRRYASACQEPSKLHEWPLKSIYLHTSLHLLLGKQPSFQYPRFSDGNNWVLSKLHLYVSPEDTIFATNRNYAHRSIARRGLLGARSEYQNTGSRIKTTTRKPPGKKNHPIFCHSVKSQPDKKTPVQKVTRNKAIM